MKPFLRLTCFNSQHQSKTVKKQRFYIRLKIFSLLIGLSFLQASVHAQQYHTYHDADSANPILNATPKPQNITGLQFFDVDGDKDLDCYVMTAGNILVLYKNVGTITRPEYKLSDSSGLEDITLPTTSFTQHFYFFDMDNDGDKDLFIEGLNVVHQHSAANNSYITTFLNDGSPQKPHFTTTNINPVPSLVQGNQYYYYFFNFQDIDGDGDMDFAYSSRELYGYNAMSGVYLNTSTSGLASFSKIQYPTDYSTSGSYPFPSYESFYDFSGDGLPDCLLYSVGLETFHPNTGTKASPWANFYDFTQGPKFSMAPITCIVDLNNDGQVEVFNDKGNYETVTPVPVLKDSTVKIGGRSVVKLTATTQLTGYKYQWEYNGKKIPGYHKPFIYAPVKGKYVLFITDSLGTGVSLPYIIAPKASTANMGSELIASTKLSMQTYSVAAYPNPFSQVINLTVKGGNLINTRTIRVSDMTGKIWLTQTTSSSTLQIGATLPKGIYQLEVWENNKLAYHTKILKQ